ncbi:MAG: caspase family protein [Nitrospira sp.]|nr:caspase family protein [Nitrospira sp.]
MGHQGEIFSLATSSNGHYLASGSGDEMIRLWDPRTGRLRKILQGHTGAVRALAFSPDSRLLASGARDRTWRLWEIGTGKELVNISTRFGSVRSLTFSPDGKTLATGGDGGNIYLWDWQTKNPQKVMKSGFGIIFSMAFSPDGHLLATGNSDAMVHLWDPSSGRQQKTFSGHRGAVLAVSISPNGQILASGGADQTIRLWDLSTGHERGILTGHTDALQSLAFSPDGLTLVSAAKDGSIRVWDWKNGQELRSFTNHRGPVWAVAFSPDGQSLASGGRDRIVQLQPFHPSMRIVQRGTPEAKNTIEVKDNEVGPPPFPPPRPQAELVIRPHEAQPGHPVELQVTIKNTGKGPVYRMKGTTQSENPIFDGQVLYFGKIEAGQQQSEVVHVQIPADHDQDTAPMQIVFEEYNGFTPPPLQAVIHLTGSTKPRLAYNYQILDDGSGQSVGNGDGRIQKGEAVDLLLTLRNVSTVPAKNTWVEINNGADQHLKIRPRVIRFGALEGETSKRARVSFTVWPDFSGAELQFKLFIQEKSEQVFLNDTLNLAVDTQPPLQIVATNKLITVTAKQASILSGAGADSSVIAAVQHDQTLAATGELGDWYRVQLSEAESGWISKNQASVTVSMAKGSMPIPIIQGLEAARTAQFITLNEQLQEAQIQREEIEQALQRREQEMHDLQAKLQHLANTENAKLSSTQEELERERAEREQTTATLQAREHEMKQLRAQLESLHSSQNHERSTMEEKLHAEHAQREQAERALRQYQTELQELKEQLTQVTTVPSPKTPPAIALASPFENQEVKVDRIQLIGAAASEKGISRIEVRVNQELQARRQGRGIAVVPGRTATNTTYEFSESVQLREGTNTISITAFDGEQISATRTLNVTRILDKGKIWAVVIGISRYDKVRPLKYADNDALAFHEYLMNDVGIPAEHLTSLINEQATLVNLKRTLGTELKRKAGPKDTVIIYYAGHGAPETDSASPDGDGLEKYLIPYDADPQDLYTTGLPMREVETIFDRIAAERVIFITDSCYSGATAGRTFSTAARRAVVSDNFLSRLAEGKGRVVLTASRASEVSEERDDLRHGVFTYYLLEGLKGKADFDADGIITVDEAYSYVSTQVPSVTGQNQHPVKKGEVEGQLIMGRVQ